MRILQAVFPQRWFDGSNDPANSLYAFIAGASSSEPNYLIDDNWYTAISPLESTKISAQQGMVFWAKDADTLKRGFRAVANDTRKDVGWDMSGGHFDLTACGLTWELGSVMMQSKAMIAIKTITHNVGLFFSPQGKTTLTSEGGGRLGQHSVTIKHRPYQSVSDNMGKVSRDNLLVQRGAAVLVVQSDKAPRVGPRTGLIVMGRNGLIHRENAERYASWGGEFRQIGSKMGMGRLASLVPDLV